MDELITRSFQGRTSEDEEECLRRWREETDEHEERYQRFAAVWRATRSYEPRIRTSPPPHEAIMVEAARRAARPRRGWTQVAGVAAALVLGLALGRWWTDGPAGPERGSELVTGADETATARLPDGTVIRLAPQSRLVVHPAGAPREVLLVGRAFFSVAHDPGHPFLVRTGAGEARVLGTRFEVSARERDLRLVVVEGRVAVSSAGKEVQLERRQVSHVREGAEPSVMEVDDVWPLLSWMGGFVAFEATPLPEVARELEHRFGVTLRIEDDELARQTVTVWFGDEPLDRVIGLLCQLVEATCTVESSTVRMRTVR